MPSHSPNFGAAKSNAAQLDQSASMEVLGRVPTVLVIQSDPIVRNLLRDLLSRNGYTLLDAIDVSEATELLHHLADDPVDLLVIDSDAGQPASLRAGAKILFTQAADAAATAETAFLQPPFTEARLLAAVSGLLNPTTQ